MIICLGQCSLRDRNVVWRDRSKAEMLYGGIDRAVGVMDETFMESRQKLMKLKENFRELVEPELAEPYTVLGHGDCWSNNFMYQYKVNIFKIILF